MRRWVVADRSKCHCRAFADQILNLNNKVRSCGLWFGGLKCLACRRSQHPLRTGCFCRVGGRRTYSEGFLNANPFLYPFSGSRHCAGLNFEEGPEGDREMRQSECVSVQRGKMEAMGGRD